MASFANILKDFKSLRDFISGGKGKEYPVEPKGLQIKQITNQPSFEDGAWQKSLGYSFMVVRVDQKTGVQVKSQDGFDEFRLQINPQELTQDEIFAIEVTPTFRGAIVEHHGTTLKDIVISGTTGMSPLRTSGGARKNTGRPYLAGGRSGYEEFHELRSYFRVYVELKRVDSRTDGELRMVFKNYKDSEYLYVEPQKFSMKRSAQKPHMYDYTIALKAIGTAEGGDSEKVAPSWLDNAMSAVDTAQEYLDLGTKTIQAGLGILLRFERDVEDVILNPIRSVSQALLALQGGRAQWFGDFNITRSFVKNLEEECRRVCDNFNDIIGKGDPGYNAATGRTTTIQGKAGRTTTYSELQIINGLNKTIKGLTLILAQKSLFQQDSNVESAVVSDTFKNKFQIPAANSVRPVTIQGNDNLHTIAARELGDPDRFRDIVVLNGLKPPYISDSGGSGVLKPGDKILIPQIASASSPNVARNVEYAITKFMAESEKNLGVDIRLNDDGDLAFSNTGDLDLIAGVDNIVQVLALKLALEKGSLKRHGYIGTDLQVGGKTTAQGLQNIRSAIVTSLTSDPRIEAIPFIELEQEGNTTFVNLVVKLRDLDQPIPVPLTITG